ncbi:pgk [Scenedesmus sp. PABB004]|nr:pgk [Scenedesmus sp. PABB004]
MGETDSAPCPAGATICCALDAPPSSREGLRCRFPGAGDVPASVCGSTVCCTPPPGADEVGDCFAVVDAADRAIYQSPSYEAQHQRLAQAGASSTLDSCIETLLSPRLDLAALPAGALRGKRVLLRADLNLPLGPGGGVTDATRLESLLPTLRLLLAGGARVAIASHLGRPEPARQSEEEMRRRFSLAPVAALLERLLPAGAFAGLAPDCVGPQAAAAVDALQPGQACLLENLRFHAGEASNDPAFAASLAALGDVCVNDAFGVVHRDQASVTGVLCHLRGYPGMLLRAELRHLHGVRAAPARPFAVVLGGAKVKDKLPVLAALIAQQHAPDLLLVGGRMAFTFLAAEGVAVGATQVEGEWLQACRDMRGAAAARGVRLLLPRDAVVARSLDDDRGCCTVPLTRGCCSADAPCVPAGCHGLDIGPASAAAFAEALVGCRTVFWNGPMGRFEVPGFAAGTAALARAVGAATEAGATTVIGGGDSVAALNQLRPRPAVSFVSTGGGASLELIQGRLLPGLRALADDGRAARPSPRSSMALTISTAAPRRAAVAARRVPAAPPRRTAVAVRASAFQAPSHGAARAMAGAAAVAAAAALLLSSPPALAAVPSPAEGATREATRGLAPRRGALAPDVAGQERAGQPGAAARTAAMRRTFVAASKENQDFAMQKYPESGVRWRRGWPNTEGAEGPQ